MRRKFCCEASREMYDDYYMRQTGRGSMPVYSGARYQRGHGIGNILGGLIRKVVPFIKDNVKTIGKNLLSTGADIAQDMIRGQKFGEAARRHIPAAIQSTVKDIDWKSTPQQVRRVAPHVLKAGADVVGDVIQGTPLKQSLEKGIKRHVQQFRGQSTSGTAKRRIKRKRKDIFG